MKASKIKVYIILFFVLLMAVLYILDFLSLICPAELITRTEGHASVIVRDSDFLCTGIAQIVSDTDNIYILFGQYGVVQVYTKQGVYKYTISVYDHRNGMIQIATDENYLYIRDKNHNLYVFSDGKQVQYIPRQEAKATQKNLDFGAWDSDYTIHAGSVWYSASNSNSHCVISRPPWMVIYQNDFIFSLLFFFAAISGAILFVPKFFKKQ